MDQRDASPTGSEAAGGVRRFHRQAATTLTERADCILISGINMSNDSPLVIEVSQLLRQTKSTVATAESCTGGLLAKLLTDVSGSSAYFSYGWVTYSNQAKSNLLDIDPKLIELHGAVSQPVAQAMAQGALKKSQSDLAIGITGIAGPDGGSEAKPVGMVCIALASKHSPTRVQTFRFEGDRQSVRNQSALAALRMVRDGLLE